MADNISYSDDAIYFFNFLISALLENHYFSYYENAEKYVFQIMDDIEKTISTKKKYISPELYKKYGSQYITIKGGNRTTWYAFFEQSGDRYIINHITNNHVNEASILCL